ncbi:MAG: glycosyltransferase, partial [Phycisphaerae bacterium]
LAGCRTDVAHCLHAMDIFLFPSQFEGMPNAMMEAQAAGLPVLASDVPSIREHVPSAGRPFLAPLDDEKRWTDLLIRLHGNAELRASQGQIQREHALEHYAFEQRVEEFLQVLEQQCGGPDVAPGRD